MTIQPTYLSTFVLALGLVVILGAPPALGEGQLVEKTVDAQSSEKNQLQARREIIDRASKEAVRMLAREMLGPDKYATNQNMIEARVLRDSSKLTASVKTGDLQVQEDGFMARVNVRVQSDELRKQLLSLGLFYSSDTSSKVLSQVKFICDTPSVTAVQLATQFEEIASQSLWKSGFYLVPALRLNMKRWGSEMVSRSTAKILLKGEIALKKDLWVLRIYAESDEKSLGEVLRKEKSGDNVDQFIASAMTDLTTQILESWQKGSLGSEKHLVKVTPALNPVDQELIKKTIMAKSVDFKNVQERRLSGVQSTFEVESSLSLTDLQSKLDGILVLGRPYVAVLIGAEISLSPKGLN